MIYLRWDEVPYAGEQSPPSGGVDPLAGTWPLFFLKRDANGNFLYPNGNKLYLEIRDPKTINFDNQLKIVQNTLRSLTKQQIEIGRYWGSGVPTKQWTPIIDRLIDTYGVSPAKAARIIAAVQGGINDVMVVVWYLKYRYMVARPDQYDSTMATLLCTPRFPAYPSGHATLSGCAATILSYFFPPEASRLYDQANECAVARLYAGVHFPIDNTEGLHLGQQIGQIVVNVLENQKNSAGQQIDIPPAGFLDADILPRHYKQFIPYEFNTACTSLVLPIPACGDESQNKKGN